MWQWWFFAVCCFVALCNGFLGSLQCLSYTVFITGTVRDNTLSYEYCSQSVNVPYTNPAQKKNTDDIDATVLVRPSPTYPFAPVQVISYVPGMAATNVICAVTTGICAYAFWSAFKSENFSRALE